MWRCGGLCTTLLEKDCVSIAFRRKYICCSGPMFSHWLVGILVFTTTKVLLFVKWNENVLFCILLLAYNEMLPWTNSAISLQVTDLQNLVMICVKILLSLWPCLEWRKTSNASTKITAATAASTNITNILLGEPFHILLLMISAILLVFVVGFYSCFCIRKGRWSRRRMRSIIIRMTSLCLCCSFYYSSIFFQSF